MYATYACLTHPAPSTQVYAVWIVVLSPLLNWTLLVTSHAAIDDRSGSNECSSVKSGASTLSCHRKELLYALAALTGASLVSAVVFFFSIVREYRKTFYKPCNVANTLADRWESCSMMQRTKIITARNPDYWPREPVRAFIAENWERWTLEKPPWFVDPLWRASVPAWALPDDAVMHASAKAYRTARRLRTVLPDEEGRDASTSAD